jgi:hypothetical protein
MFSKKQGSQIGSPLLRQVDSPSLFSSSLKSKYMSPVKIVNVPQKEISKEKSKYKSLYYQDYLTYISISYQQFFQNLSEILCCFD